MRQGRRIAVAVVVGCVPLSLAVAAPAATSPAAGLKKLLPRAGEMTGFTASGPVHVFTSIGQDLAYDPAPLRKSDAANLLKDGFRAELIQGQVGTGKTGGTSGVTELKSATAAHAYDTFTFAVVAKPGPVSGSAAQVRFRLFKVPGVPGARGAAEISRTKQASDANVQWVEGSCMIQVGDGTPSTTPLTAPLISAAQKIYKRTKGSCTTTRAFTS